MGLASGLASQWCALDEVTYGVIPSLTAAPFTIFDTDGLELKKGSKQGAGIYAGAVVPASARRVVTEYSASGPVNGELPAQGLNKWLFRMFGSFGQSNATLTQDLTTGAYKAVHYLGPLEGHTFAFQKGVTGVDGTVSPFSYAGCKITEWEISATMGEITKWAMTIEARSEVATGGVSDPLNVSVPSLVSFTAPPGGVFYWSQGSVLYGGTPSTTGNVTSISGPTAAGRIKAFSMKQTRPMDLERFSPELLGFRNEPLQNAVLPVTGSITVEWLSSQAYYGAYANDTATSIQLGFTGPVIGTGTDHSSLSLLASNIRLEGESPKIPGPAVLTQTIPFTVLDDRVNNTLQATYWTLDTT